MKMIVRWLGMLAIGAALQGSLAGFALAQGPAPARVHFSRPAAGRRRGRQQYRAAGRDLADRGRARNRIAGALCHQH